MLTVECPNCGASLPDDGVSSSVACTFCGTRMTIPRNRPPVSSAASAADRRTELEIERNQLNARVAEWDTRLSRTRAAGIGDLLMPPFLGYAVALPLFLAIVFYMMRHVEEYAARNDSTSLKIAIIGTGVLFILVAIATIIRRRRSREERVAKVTAARDAAVGPLLLRLREVEGELRRLGPNQS